MSEQDSGDILTYSAKGTNAHVYISTMNTGTCAKMNKYSLTLLHTRTDARMHTQEGWKVRRDAHIGAHCHRHMHSNTPTHNLIYKLSLNNQLFWCYTLFVGNTNGQMHGSMYQPITPVTSLQINPTTLSRCIYLD